MITLNPIEKDKAENLAEEYFELKGIEPLDVVIGFIKKNRLGDCSVKDIDLIIESAKKLNGGTLFGSGDRFKLWCENMGREIPSNDIIHLMNEDEYLAGISIAKQIPDHPKVWRSYCSYRACRGR